MPSLNADEILPGLWQGALPRIGTFVSDHGFDCLVLSASEVLAADPRAARAYKNLDVIEAPLDDNSEMPFPADQRCLAHETAVEVVRRLDAGQNVLVTCLAGRNRSGLIVALALHRWKGWSGDYCARFIRSRRPTALYNTHFVAMLGLLKGIEGPALKGFFGVPDPEEMDGDGRFEDEPG